MPAMLRLPSRRFVKSVTTPFASTVRSVAPWVKVAKILPGKDVIGRVAALRSRFWEWTTFAEIQRFAWSKKLSKALAFPRHL